VRTAIASVAVLAGAAFMFVAALGVARLPDLYTRMHAATKPASVGIVAVMSGVALAAYEVPVTARAALVALFFLLTAPVAAHAIARSAHTRRVPLAPGTRVEDGAAEAQEAAAQPEPAGGPRRIRAAGSSDRSVHAAPAAPFDAAKEEQP
jgi:multicomponent Na+:H+ antiporter subunit G